MYIYNKNGGGLWGCRGGVQSEIMWYLYNTYIVA